MRYAVQIEQQSCCPRSLNQADHRLAASHGLAATVL